MSNESQFYFLPPLGSSNSEMIFSRGGRGVFEMWSSSPKNPPKIETMSYCNNKKSEIGAFHAWHFKFGFSQQERCLCSKQALGCGLWQIFVREQNRSLYGRMSKQEPMWKDEQARSYLIRQANRVLCDRVSKHGHIWQNKQIGFYLTSRAGRILCDRTNRQDPFWQDKQTGTYLTSRASRILCDRTNKQDPFWQDEQAEL